jgi:predicted nuclease with TOPRIM domain
VGLSFPPLRRLFPPAHSTNEQELTVAIDVKQVREKRAECMAVIDGTMRETGALRNQARRLEAQIAGLRKQRDYLKGKANLEGLTDVRHAIEELEDRRDEVETQFLVAQQRQDGAVQKLEQINDEVNGRTPATEQESTW